MGFFKKSKPDIPATPVGQVNRYSAPTTAIPIDVDRALSAEDESFQKLSQHIQPQSQPQSEIPEFMEEEDSNMGGETEVIPEQKYIEERPLYEKNDPRRFQQPQSVVQTTQFPQSKLSEEEQIIKMREELAKREEGLRLKKLEEERQREFEQQQNQPQPAISAQPIYMSEAELLRDISTKINALCQWAINMTEYIKGIGSVK